MLFLRFMALAIPVIVLTITAWPVWAELTSFPKKFSKDDKDSDDK